ncbi:arsenate reductase (glutaredoxin) [Candidatus Marinamargulisbacteria bacterium SCGC AAA071-K20]|nr:arsenate reductase (glutaredoxin) [Candidatus Marinamargulisbacteria bacterium SCGC AAA071-K20]
MNLIYYHNPRCSKSRQGLQLLGETPVVIREYLKDPLDIDELKALFKSLSLKPIEVIRSKEAKALGLSNMTDDEWIKAISDHPILLERPIISNGSKALIGRPPELISDFIK